MNKRGIESNNYKHGMYNSKFYNLWKHIKGRCFNKNDQAYSYYGGRGITICDEWIDDFNSFYKYISLLSKFDKVELENLTLDRIDNNKNYEIGNLRWATRLTQSINRGIYKNNTSGIKGINFNALEQKWKVRVTKNMKRITLGTFVLLEEAKNALNNYKLKTVSHE